MAQEALSPMQDQPIQDRGHELDRVERHVLYLLTDETDNTPTWSVPDIGRAIEDHDSADIAVHGLRQAGLIQRTSDGFVFATRAAVRVVQLIGRVI
jgi:hypothetical protein